MEDKKDNSLFYCDIETNETVNDLISELREYSAKSSKQIYILNRVLGTERKYSYEISDIAIVLMSNYPILLINYGKASEEKLEDFLLDFKEDLGYLSDKYDYKAILGRSRKWSKNLFYLVNLKDFDLKVFIENKKIEHSDYRKVDLLISLIIGSINDINKIKTNIPNTLLEKVKQKIILFDGQQSRFIYQNINQKTVTIQGMAGTGKTELLLHKLKDVYLLEKDSVIAFTCFNKVLARDMQLRIPNFFNFLKVEEQIEWQKRMFVFSSWGSSYNHYSGLYSFVCYKYNLPFSSYGDNHDFDFLCFSALELLNKIENFTPCFDYIFIDESQDFKEGFFELCKKITKNTVYIAGDIFQNIFDSNFDIKNINPDFLLNKCYRVDPKTLMFAHAVGMGLYEETRINWLDDDSWLACGYSLEQGTQDNIIKLGRAPLHRFEDLETTNTVRLLTSDSSSYCEKILNAIDEIKKENPTVTSEDIAIIILGNYKILCSIVDKTTYLIKARYDWNSNIGYISKSKQKDSIYISNENNIKGLEFPFVICVVTQSIDKDPLLRNSIYMALTRSFLTSYFIVDDVNSDFYEIYSKAIKNISAEGIMTIKRPDEEELKKINKLMLSYKTQTISQLDDILKDYPELSNTDKEFINNFISKYISPQTSLNEAKQKIHNFVEKFILDRC